jgi:hypothetical protein
MKITETRTETVTRKVEVGQSCDLCGRDLDEVEQERARGRRPDGVAFDRGKVTIMHEIGQSWGDGAVAEALPVGTLEVDCCIACFEDKVLPFLRSIGLTRDYDYASY